MSANLDALEQRILSGQDNAMVRFAVGRGHLDLGNHLIAAQHLSEAVRFNPEYSAAWALLGKARQAGGDTEGAIAAYQAGLDVSQRNGDLQSFKQMQVFLNRLTR